MLKLAIPVLLLVNFGEPRVAQETNRAPDVVAPYTEAAPAVPAASPASETAKADAEFQAAAKIKLQYVQIFRAQTALAQANGRVEVFKDRLDKAEAELGGLWNERLDLEIDLVAAKEGEKQAQAELENQRAENDRVNKKLEATTAWNRKLVALHFITLIFIPFGILMYFGLRRQNAGILARLPDEDTKDIFQTLRGKLEKYQRDLSDTRQTCDDLLMKRNALSKMFDEEHAERMELDDQNGTLRQTVERLVAELVEKTSLADARSEDIKRLIALQQGSEATIIRLTEEAVELAGESVAKRSEVENTDPLPAALPPHSDPDVIAANSAMIDAIEASRASMHVVDHGDAVPEKVDPADEQTRKMEKPQSGSGTEGLPSSELPPIADETPDPGYSR